MSKKAVLYIIGSLVFVMMYSVAMIQTGILIGRSSVKPQVESKETTVKEGYIVKESGGAIRIFEDGSETPIRALNIREENLTQSDKQKFIEGIKLDTLEDVIQLEEDFSS